MEPFLAVGEVERAEPFEEGLVGRGARHEEVLAVVDLAARLVVAEGVGGAAGPGAAFEHFHLVPEIGKLQPRGQPGEPRADDPDLHGHAGVSPIARAPAGRLSPRVARSRRLLASVQAHPLGEHVVVARLDPLKQLEVHALQHVHAHARAYVEQGSRCLPRRK